MNVAEWAMTWQKKVMLDQIMDKNTDGKVNSAPQKKFGETAIKYPSDYGFDMTGL